MHSIVRRLVLFLDSLIRRATGLSELCPEKDCLFRVRLVVWPREVRLRGGQIIPKGATVLDLHLWNEHLPPLPPGGPDLAWAARGWRMLRFSLGVLAAKMAGDPEYRRARAVVGVLSLPVLNGMVGGERLLRGLGFELLPRQARLGRFGVFWENLYAGWVLWAYNPRRFEKYRGRLKRLEAWALVEDLVARYGGARIPSPQGRPVARRSRDSSIDRGGANI